HGVDGEHLALQVAHVADLRPAVHDVGGLVDADQQHDNRRAAERRVQHRPGRGGEVDVAGEHRLHAGGAADSQDLEVQAVLLVEAALFGNLQGQERQAGGG